MQAVKLCFNKILQILTVMLDNRMCIVAVKWLGVYKLETLTPGEGCFLVDVSDHDMQ